MTTSMSASTGTTILLVAGVAVIIALEGLQYIQIVRVDVVYLEEDFLVFTSPVPNLKLKTNILVYI